MLCQATVHCRPQLRLRWQMYQSTPNWSRHLLPELYTRNSFHEIRAQIWNTALCQVTVYCRSQLRPSWQIYQSTPNSSRHLLGTCQAVSLSPDNFASLAAFDIDSPCEPRSSYVFSIYSWRLRRLADDGWHCYMMKFLCCFQLGGSRVIILQLPGILNASPHICITAHRRSDFFVSFIF